MNKRKIPVPALARGQRLKGASTLVRPDGSTAAQWIKTERAPVDRTKQIAALMRSFGRKIQPAPKSRAPEQTEADLLNVYPLGDPHIGLLAWGRETDADFDLKIAERVMCDAMEQLVKSSPAAREALIVNVGDFFHADNLENHTTKGTHRLDVDGRTPRVLQVGLAVICRLIDTALRRHQRVTFLSVPGNHDAYTALWLPLAVREHYRLDPRVVVPVTERARAYYEFGQNLIGVAHGDRQSAADLCEIMAAEEPQRWGRCSQRLWITGHVHHDRVREYRGARVESIRTMAARDSWHAGQGYSAGRDMKRITLHRKWGEIERAIVSVDRLLSPLA